MKKVIALALGAALTLSLASCGGEKTEEAVAETAAVGVAVQTMTVERREMASENTVSGRINAEDEAVIMIGVAAKCTKTNVKAGDEVKKGDILCTLDLASTLSQYSAAQISYASAVQSYNDQKALLDKQVDMAEKQITMLESQITLTRRQIDLAVKNADDTKALLDIGAASQMEYDNAVLSRDQAQFQLSQLELQLENARMGADQARTARTSTLSQMEAGIQNAKSGVQQMDNVLEDVDAHGNVIAPMSGTLITFNAKENNYISNTAPLAVINGASQMKLTVSVSEALVPKLVSGDQADVYVSAVDQSFSATIRSVERSANAQTRLYTVTLTLPEDVQGLMVGMSADVTFHTDKIENTVVIPSQAVLNSSGTEYVYVVEGESAKYVQVVTGVTGTGVTQIISGLEGGEELVIVGQTYLSDGSAVRVVSEGQG